MTKTTNNQTTKATSIKKLLEQKFVPSKKVLQMKDGFTNFATCSEEFLAHAELINKGTGELSDIKARFTDELESAENKLNLYLKGKVIDSLMVASLQGEVARLKEEKNIATKNIRDYMPKMTDADKNLYVAYYWYQEVPEKESYDGEYLVLYKRAFMEWFDSFNMVMGKKDFDFFSRKLGLKKASNKVYRESNACKFTSTLNARAFIELLYGIIIELMIKKGLIKNYELQYVSVKEESKQVEEVKEEKKTLTRVQIMELLDKANVTYKKSMKLSELVDIYKTIEK